MFRLNWKFFGAKDAPGDLFLYFWINGLPRGVPDFFTDSTSFFLLPVAASRLIFFRPNWAEVRPPTRALAGTGGRGLMVLVGWYTPALGETDLDTGSEWGGKLKV